jgi:hypothetical protein
MLFAYIGPETMYPVASIIAALMGVFMMFGRNVTGFCRRMFRRVWPGPQRKPVTSVSQNVTTGVSQTPGESLADKPEAPSAI